MTHVPPVLAYVGVGANLDGPREQVRTGIAALHALPGCAVEAVSGLYASAPVDASGPDYVNAVVALRAACEADELLRALQAIEARAGRVRSMRNAPRPLDLDLLAYGDLQVQTPTLTLPHPRLHRRAFVLHPLLEIAPDLRLPGLGALAPWLETVAEQRIRRIEPAPPAGVGFA